MNRIYHAQEGPRGEGLVRVLVPSWTGFNVLSYSCQSGVSESLGRPSRLSGPATTGTTSALNDGLPVVLVSKVELYVKLLLTLPCLNKPFHVPMFATTCFDSDSLPCKVTKRNVGRVCPRTPGTVSKRRVSTPCRSRRRDRATNPSGDTLTFDAWQSCVRCRDFLRVFSRGSVTETVTFQKSPPLLISGTPSTSLGCLPGRVLAPLSKPPVVLHEAHDSFQERPSVNLLKFKGPKEETLCLIGTNVTVKEKGKVHLFSIFIYVVAFSVILCYFTFQFISPCYRVIFM